jgi:hypothetical protein
MKTTLYLALLSFFVFNPDLLQSQYSTITEINVNGRTVYDMQSLGSAHMLEVNPLNPLEMHACFLVSTDPPPAYANRNVRYFYTTNGGNSWDYIGEVALTRAGFPSLTTTNDNRAIILTSSSDNGAYARKFILILLPVRARGLPLTRFGKFNCSVESCWYHKSYK